MITKIFRSPLLYLAIVLFPLSISHAMAQYDVVPLPQNIQMQKGETFVFNADVQILAGEGLQREAEFLRQ